MQKELSSSIEPINSYIQDYIDLKLVLQQNVLDYLSDEEENSDSYPILIQTINSQEITQRKADLVELLHFLIKLSNNYHRNQTFFFKIEKILIFLKESLKKLISDAEIFNIFKGNKKMLLFLFEEKIISPNQTIANVLTSKKYKRQNYYYYFYPEIKPFTLEEENKKDFGKYYNEDQESFKRKRKIGENDEYICNLIRNDSVIDFIAHVTKTNRSLNSQVPSSIYETNKFLINKTPTLIEYATFFGSIQIFNYLCKNNVDLTETLWNYAMHGNNPEIIHLLEENNIDPVDCEYDECFNEAIKCHHNSIANYIKNKILQDEMNEEEQEMLRIMKEKYKRETYVPNMADEEYWYDNYNEEKKCEKKDEKIDLKKEDEKCEENDKKFDLKDEEENYGDINEQELFDANEFPPNLFIKYFNYAYFDIKMLNDPKVYYNLCKYDYPSLFSIIYNNSQIDFDKNKLLAISIKKGNNDIAKLLLENQEIDINKKSLFYKKRIISTNKREYFKCLYILEKEEKTPLFMAAENENIEILKLLLSKQNIDINIISTDTKWNRYGIDREECWFSYHYFKFINWWENQVFSGEDNGVEDRKEKVIKRAALTVSVEKNNIEIVKLLLSHQGIDVNVKTTKKKWKFQHTEDRRYGDEECIIEEIFPLKMVIINKNIELTRLLLSHHDININEKAIYKSAFINTSKHIWKEFYISEEEQTLLSFAIEYNNLQALVILISQQNSNDAIKVNKRSRNIEYESDIRHDYYQIHYWQIEKRIKDIKNDYLYSLRTKEDLKYYTTNESTYQKSLLFNVINNENLEMLKILLENFEIDLNIKDNRNQTLLQSAIKKENSAIVEFLLSTNKIDINAKISRYGTDQKTALHVAIEKNNLEILKLLLAQSDIDVNADYYQRDYIRYCEKAIHLAEHDNLIEIFELLIANPKTDINANAIFNENKQDKYEKNVLQLAMDHGHKEIVRMILSHPKFNSDKAEINK